MTEYEILDLLTSHREEAAYHVMNFAGVMFGYVAAAYFVGAKLSTFEAWVITILYSLFAPLPAGAAYESLHAIRELSELHQAGVNFSLDQTPTYIVGPEAISAMIFISWLISAIFMYRIRRKTLNHAST